MASRARLSLCIVASLCACQGGGGNGDTTSNDTAGTGTSTTTAPSNSGDGFTSQAATDGPDSTSGAASSDSKPEGDSTVGPPPFFDVGRIPDLPDQTPPDIYATVVADGAYMMGTGPAEGPSNYWDGSGVPGEFCDSDPTVLLPGDTDYIYIAAFADTEGTHGLLGRFSHEGPFYGPVPPLNPTDVHTGDSRWEVCPTGQDFDPAGDWPTPALVNDQIAVCNEAEPEAAQRWIGAEGDDSGRLAIGERNDTPLDGAPQAGNEFPPVCVDLISDQARWMWFNWDPVNLVWPKASPFFHPGTDDNPAREFLIFRLPTAAVP